MSVKSFFATRSDMEPGILKIESEVKLKYVAIGWRPTPDYEVFYSALEIPEFGKAMDIVYLPGERRIYLRSYYTGVQKFLVCTIDTEIVVEAVPQNAGGILYMIDFDHNPGAFWFMPSGLYDASTLVGGSIVPNSLYPDVRKLCFKFGRALTKGFVKIQDEQYVDWYVGPEALELLKHGAELVTRGYHPLQMPGNL